MTEYISKDRLRDAAYWHGDMPTAENMYPEGVDAVDVSAIDKMTPDDVREMKRGVWEDIPHYFYRWNTGKPVKVMRRQFRCPFCGRGAVNHSPYCPGCGAALKPSTLCIRPPKSKKWIQVPTEEVEANEVRAAQASGDGDRLPAET